MSSVTDIRCGDAYRDAGRQPWIFGSCKVEGRAADFRARWEGHGVAVHCVRFQTRYGMRAIASHDAETPALIAQALGPIFEEVRGKRWLWQALNAVRKAAIAQYDVTAAHTAEAASDLLAVARRLADLIDTGTIHAKDEGRDAVIDLYSSALAAIRKADGS